MNHVALHPAGSVNLISLCTGGAGLDLGVELAIPDARPVVLVEGEVWSVATLVSAMEARLLAPAPVWSDVRTFDGRPWRGLVDGLIGGIPCQPHSLAGKRKGEDDERDLWSSTRRIVVQARPWFVLIENVCGMLSAQPGQTPGAERVWRDLQRLGYAVEFGIFTAEEVGASHERKRVFILAVDDHAVGRWSPEQSSRGRDRTQGQDRGRGCDVADTIGQQLGTGRAGRERTGGTGPYGQPAGSGQGLGRPDSTRLEGRRSGPDERSGERIAGTAGEQLADSASERGWGIPVQQGRQDEARPDTKWSGSELANAGRIGDERRREPGDVSHAPGSLESEGHQRQRRGNATDDSCDGAVNPGRNGRREGRTEPGEDGGRFAAAAGASGELVHPFGRGHDGLTQEPVGGSIRRTAFERTGGDCFPRLYPPGPSDLDGWRRVLAHSPELEPAVRRMADGVAARLDLAGPHAARIERLRMLGNGVVPLEAAFALRSLATRLARRSAGAAELVRMMVS